MKEKIITEWHQVGEFAGKIVAYKCVGPTSPLASSSSRYILTAGDSWGCGLISTEPHEKPGCSAGLGYHIKVLQKQFAHLQISLHITDSFIAIRAGGSITMRLPERKELQKIKQAIDHDEAEFPFHSKDEVKAIMIGQLDDCPPLEW